MKKRSILDSVGVKSPCSQDWDAMYGNDEVRFCEHCVKHVHDLSAMTRRTAEKFVRDANGSVCVRYVRRPDGKMQTAGDKLYQISARASRVAAGVFGASLTLASSVYAQSETVQTNVDPAQMVITLGEITPLPQAKGGASISGTVFDPNGAVLPGAEVILTEQKTGAIRSMKTNEDGGYLFPTVEEGIYKLEFNAAGFQGHKIENINFKDRIDAEFDAVLNIRGGIVVGDMVVATEYENQLVRSVYYGDFERIKSLVAQGVNVNEKDHNGSLTALHVAVRKGDLKTITILLELGAKVNLRDERGRTAIMQIGEDYESEGSDENEENEDETEESVMARMGTRIFELLISHGAKVNLRDSEGFTALMYAAQSENPALLKLLLSHRANVNTQAKNGRTALMEAANEGEIENVRILLQAGAAVNLKDDEGETAMSLTGNDVIEELLLSYGAKPEEPGDN